MKIVGFSFIRNAIRFDYPIVEAVKSVLPICDQFVIAVGQSDDQTRALVASIGDPKIIIIDTIWDDALREGGKVLAVETDKAFQSIGADADWCIYIQGDEVLHEKDYPAIVSAMEYYLKDTQTEGLLFKYLHFYGSYDFIGASRKWYRREVRIVRNDKRIFSFKDAQGFRILDGGVSRKLRVRLIDAFIHHYGWVKHPLEQQQKQLNFNKLWHSDHWVAQHIPAGTQFTYQESEPLARFTGNHPKVMQNRISAVNWHFKTDPGAVKWSIKEKISAWIEQKTGWRPGEYRNYQLLK